MIVINKFAYDPSTSNLVYDIKIRINPDTSSAYSGFYIKKVEAFTEENWGSSEEPTLVIYDSDTAGTDITSLVGSIPYGSISYNGIIILKATTEGTPPMDIPCGQDNLTAVAALINPQMMHTLVLSKLNSVTNCEFPTDFVDSYLKMKVVELALKSCKITKAVQYYNEFYNHINSITDSGGCNCGNN